MGHLIFGIIAIICGLSGVFIWWADFGRIVRGVVPLGLVIVGLVAIGAAMSSRRKRDEQEKNALPELEPKRVSMDSVLGTEARMEKQPAP